ncbi:MAG: helix-hairpin-helix domain-containing protein [Methanophagales archaeon]|nr:helix-hairpin-helix domain-containing protein [Methanophagales archaeon]
MELLVDTREPSNVKNYAKSLGFKLYALPAGDFALRDKKTFKYLALIERKNIGDLAQSITSRNVSSSLPRVFQQAERMKMFSEINYLLLVGTITELRMKLHQIHLEVHDEVIYGAISSIIVRSGINLLWVSSIREGVKISFKVLTKISEGKYLKPPLPKRVNRKEDVLANIPGVSKTVAKNLIKKYGSIAMICKKSQSELQSVSGIGRVRAEMIFKFLHK